MKMDNFQLYNRIFCLVKVCLSSNHLANWPNTQSFVTKLIRTSAEHSDKRNNIGKRHDSPGLVRAINPRSIYSIDFVR